jgi:hypothetical protein
MCLEEFAMKRNFPGFGDRIIFYYVLLGAQRLYMSLGFFVIRKFQLLFFFFFKEQHSYLSFNHAPAIRYNLFSLATGLNPWQVRKGFTLLSGLQRTFVFLSK